MADVRVIATGIKTKEELYEAIQMGVTFGQGNFIQKAQPCMMDISKEQKAIEVYNHFKEHPYLSVLPVINEEQEVLGVLTRSMISDGFSGRYGFSLSEKRFVEEMMDKNVLIVDYETSIEKVAQKALKRSRRKIYDSVIVSRDGAFFGLVSVKKLLETTIDILVNRAAESNPLTGLPGNIVIDETLSKVMLRKEPFAVIYIDLDNFKAYNDAYGFQNGDMMIKAVAESMVESCRNGEFIGHIGGDDFVIITDYWDIEKMLEEVIQRFRDSIVNLYSKEDYERGYINSKNRKGMEEQFPIAALSMAVITNQKRQFCEETEFSEMLVKIKKESKTRVGNSYVIF